MKIWRNLNRALDAVIETMKVLATLLIIFICVAVIVDVICMSFFSFSPKWVMELSEYSLLFITLLGSTWLLREDGHIRFDIVVNRVNKKIQRVFEMISSLLGTGLFAVITIYSWKTTVNLYERGVNTESLLKVPKYVLIAIIPICSFFMILMFVRRLVKTIGEVKQGD